MTTRADDDAKLTAAVLAHWLETGEVYADVPTIANRMRCGVAKVYKIINAARGCPEGCHPHQEGRKHLFCPTRSVILEFIQTLQRERDEDAALATAQEAELRHLRARVAELDNGQDMRRWVIDVRPNAAAEWADAWRGPGEKVACKRAADMVRAGVHKENIRVRELTS